MKNRTPAPTCAAADMDLTLHNRLPPVPQYIASSKPAFSHGESASKASMSALKSPVTWIPLFVTIAVLCLVLRVTYVQFSAQLGAVASAVTSLQYAQLAIERQTETVVAKSQSAALAKAKADGTVKEAPYGLLKHRFTLPVENWADQELFLSAVRVPLTNPARQVRPGVGKSSYMHALPPEDIIFSAKDFKVAQGNPGILPELTGGLTNEFTFAPDAVVLDIGCNMGIVSLPIAVGLRNEVICVEPIAWNCRALYRSAVLNGITDTYHVLCGAAGAESGETDIYVPYRSDNSALSATSATANVGGVAKAEHVKVYALDDVLLDFPRLNKISLIKIDVQGFEFSVLKGMKEILKRVPNAVIHAENDGKLMRNAGVNANDLYSFMRGLGYQAYCGGNLIPAPNFPGCYDVDWKK